MANANLTAQRLRELLHYDPDTGVFTWRMNRRGTKAVVGAPAGFVNGRGYIQMGVSGKPCMGHRLAWLYVYGEWPKLGIDHINGIKTDNRIANLREADPTINNQNMIKANSRSASGFRGVSRAPYGSRWESRISANGRCYFLGSYETPEQAHAAHVEAKTRLHQGFAPVPREAALSRYSGA